MATELLAAGYVQLRTGSPVDEWFVELRDDTNDPVGLDDGASGTVFRLDASDSRVTATDNPGTDTLTFEIVLDADDVTPEAVELPVTVEAAVLFAAVSGGSALSAAETFPPFTFGSPTDTCTFRVHVQLPVAEE